MFADRLSIVIVAKDATALKRALASDAISPITYDGEKPQPLLDEDKVIGALKLNISPDNIRITPISSAGSRSLAAWTDSCPRPGQLNTVSVMTAPATRSGTR